MALPSFRPSLVALAFSVVVPTGALPQSATVCVDSSYSAVLNEINRLEGSSSIPKGVDYLPAYGWVRATSACLDHAVYPSHKLQSVADFRGSIERLLQQLSQAIRTDSSPAIYAMGVGAGKIRLFPTTAPAPGAAAQSGMFMLSLDDAKRLQRALKRRGLYTGPIDGALGENSYRAIRRYQRSMGKPVTGVLSPEDLRDLL